MADATSDTSERNRRAAVAFYDLIFHQGRPREALMRYAGDEFVEHNVLIDGGRQAFVDHFEQLAARHPGKRVEIDKAVASGDLVVLHCVQRWPGCSDRASVDIFRFDAAGRIVEHWDALQVLPPDSGLSLLPT